MEFYTSATSSNIVEQYVVKKLNLFTAPEDAKEHLPEAGTEVRPVYKVTITVEQVEPKL